MKGARRCDVVVVGGGPAGAAAALAAAQAGARTVLVERDARLGGNATHALVHTICGLYEADADAPRAVHAGLPARLADALVRAGGADAPEAAGRVFYLPIRPPVFAGLLERACEKAPGLEVRVGCELVGLRRADAGEGFRLALREPEGEAALDAALVLDTSGEAAAAAALGADTAQAASERLQRPSFIFRMEGVEPGAVEGFARIRLSAAVARAARDGAVPAAGESVVVRPDGDGGAVYATLTLPPLPGRAYAPLDAEHLRALHAAGLDASGRVAAFLRETRPGFGAARVADWPARVGVREARRVAGRVEMTRDDVLGGVRRDDEVALSSWPIELWEDHRRARFELPQAPCSVPLGALTSASDARLGAAGRCLSASHEALGALRVIGTALATGEALGVAAALAADAGATLADVDPVRVRERIAVQADGYVFPVTDRSVLEAIRAHGRERAAHPALVAERGGESEAISYAALVRRVDALAARLRDAGLRPGERCGLVARQGAGFVTGALAILEAGACLVPLPDDDSDAAREATAARARIARIVFEAEDFACRARDAPPAAPDVEAAFRALDPAYLRFTSGTTAERKGVVLSHARIAERLAAANRGLAIGPDDRVLWLLPMAHHFVVSILLYLRFGATILLPAGSLARPVLELAVRERATVAYASPFHYTLLAKDASELVPPLRLAVSTAEGLRAHVAEAFRARFGRPLVQALGIIEVGLPVINLDAAEAKPTALGRPLPDYDVWLRGDDGRPVEASAPERTGEICIRGPGLFDAYLDPWTPSASLLEPDGFRTGDQGWFDADGALHLAGRRHNRINMAGMKFFSEEVEAVIARHAGVRECRVRAREHPRLGEIPVAEVVPADAARPPPRGELVALCRAELPAYKVPREFRIVAALERTPTGKVAR